eukprot:8567767-Pyramimonas_sp.AAC.1
MKPEGERASLHLTRDQWVLDRRRREGMRCATLSAAPGIFGERRELALAANSGHMVDGVLTFLVDIGSNINLFRLKTARAFERVSRPHGHDIAKLDLTTGLYVSGVGQEAAVCDKLRDCAQGKGATPRGHPRLP